MVTHGISRIEIDQNLCVGNGECVVIAPEIFDQRAQDGVSVVIGKPTTADLERALLAAVSACPSGAISVVTGSD
jgi:ferredoxin